MAENTKSPFQIVSQTGLKVVVQVNYADTVPSGISKQVTAANTLHDQYAARGMKPGKDYEREHVRIGCIGHKPVAAQPMEQFPLVHAPAFVR